MVASITHAGCGSPHRHIWKNHPTVPIAYSVQKNAHARLPNSRPPSAYYTGMARNSASSGTQAPLSNAVTI